MTSRPQQLGNLEIHDGRRQLLLRRGNLPIVTPPEMALLQAVSSIPRKAETFTFRHLPLNLDRFS